MVFTPATGTKAFPVLSARATAYVSECDPSLSSSVNESNTATIVAFDAKSGEPH